MVLTNTDPPCLNKYIHVMFIQRLSFLLLQSVFIHSTKTHTSPFIHNALIFIQCVKGHHESCSPHELLSNAAPASFSIRTTASAVCAWAWVGDGGVDLWGRLEATWTRFASRVCIQTPVGGAKRAKSALYPAQLLTVECVKLYLLNGCDSTAINTHHILRPNCSRLWSTHEKVMTQRADRRAWPLERSDALKTF